MNELMSEWIYEWMNVKNKKYREELSMRIWIKNLRKEKLV